MVATELDVRFVLDLCFDASMPTAAAARAVAFVRRHPEHAEVTAEVWNRHFGSPLYSDYLNRPAGAW
jgi:hypothetical protein